MNTKQFCIKAVQIFVLLVMVVFFLWVLRGRSTEPSEKAIHITKQSTLRQMIVEICIQRIEHPPTSTIDFLEWIQTYALSTNRPAEKLRTDMEAVWINNNSDDWVTKADRKHPPTTETVLVARYEANSKSFLVGMDIDGESFSQNKPPNSGFSKLKLKK